MNELYNNLMKLCNENEAFSYSDHFNIESTYRIFNYRLAGYTDFLNPGALECRGIMFEIDSDGNPVRIASRTMKKFFNYKENPFTIFGTDFDKSEIVYALDKLDGSLISTFINEKIEVQLKSKGSLTSDHAVLGNELLKKDNEKCNEIMYLESLGYTINFELLSPKFRIVVKYQEDELRFLNAIHRESGEYLDLDFLKEKCPNLYSTSVFKDGVISPRFPLKDTLDQSMNAVYEITDDIEGFVVLLKNGTTMKIKTNRYCSLHYSKESVLIDSRLFEVVLCEASDDLKQLFNDDPYSLERIKKMEQHVFMCYNRVMNTASNFYLNNKDLDRKSYALKCIAEVPKEFNMQGLAFELYKGKTPDYKENLRKYMREVLSDF